MKRKVLTVSVLKIIASIIFLFSILTVGSFAQAVYAQETPFFNGESDQIDPIEAGKNLSIPSKIPELQEQVSIDVFPESPKPEDTVTITARTFGVDTNTNLYTWIVNGKEALKGIGQNKFTFQVGLTGTVTTVKLYIDPKNGPRITKDFSYSPVDVDLLWQANTYTPPFYKGKALYTPESEVVFTALPNMIVNGRKIDPSDVIYRWKMDYKLQNDVSGFGKNNFSYKGQIILRQNLIQAEVYSASDPTIKGINGYKLNHVNPQALIYEEHPLLGILFNKALYSEFSLNKSEVKFAAFPLHFSTSNKNILVDYKWELNGAKLDIPSDQNTAIFRRSNTTEGASFLSVTIGNSSHILQRSRSAFNILYSNIQTATAFGSN